MWEELERGMERGNVIATISKYKDIILKICVLKRNGATAHRGFNF